MPRTQFSVRPRFARMYARNESSTTPVRVPPRSEQPWPWLRDYAEPDEDPQGVRRKCRPAGRLLPVLFPELPQTQSPEPLSSHLVRAALMRPLSLALLLLFGVSALFYAQALNLNDRGFVLAILIGLVGAYLVFSKRFSGSETAGQILLGISVSLIVAALFGVPIVGGAVGGAVVIIALNTESTEAETAVSPKQLHPH